jgi:hypothetical protein
MIAIFLFWLQERIKRWTKPATLLLAAGFLSDLPRNRSDLIVENALLRWHRELFRCYWHRKLQGRPKISFETINLIRRLAKENILWGTERIQGELLKLGITLSKRIIPKYLLHDRDSKYASHFSEVVASSGIKEVKAPYRTPRANGICERFMGSLRRKCLDHILIHDGRHCNGWLRNIQLTSIRTGHIRVLISASLAIMIYQCQTQAGELHPGQFWADCTIVIPVRQF